MPLVNKINDRIRMWLKRCNLPDYIVVYDYECNNEFICKDVLTDVRLHINKYAEIIICEDLIESVEEYTLSEMNTLINNYKLIKSGYVSDYNIFKGENNILPFNIKLRSLK